MKTLLLATMAAFGLVLGAVPAQGASTPATRLNFVQGDVQIKTSTTEEFGPASINQPVGESDQLWLPDGALAELQMLSGAYVRLDQQSAAQVLTSAEKSLQFSLTQGHAYVFYDAPKGGSFQIDTPKHSIRAFDNAVFRVDLAEGGDTVGVFDGSVEVETSEGLKRVNRGQMLSFTPEGGVDIGPAGRPDDWENWNNQRNAALAPKDDKDDKSKSYLPKELQTYSADMTSGKWVESTEHGHVWRPSDVDDEWSPYEYGRWIWYAGEYTWVGYEPWGWAPYHYGRWVYLPGVGWAWLPPVEYDVYWSPGYVAWYETDDYVGWVPLGPGEIYYGYGYYGRHCVDIRLGHHHGEHHHHHFHNHHGLKVVARSHFGEHGHGYKYAKMNSQSFGQHAKGAGFVAGGPKVQPSRGTSFASGKIIGAGKAPPSHVSHFKPAEFKQSRALTTQRGQSAFAPGGAPRNLAARTVNQPKAFGGGGAGSAAGRFSGATSGGGPRGANRFSQGQMGGGNGKPMLGHANGGSGRPGVGEGGGARSRMRNSFQAHGGGRGAVSRSERNFGGGGSGGSRHFSRSGQLRSHPGHFGSGGGRSSNRAFSGGGGRGRGFTAMGGRSGGSALRMPSGGGAKSSPKVNFRH